MATAKRQLAEIRSNQFVLIARAGMAIPSYEMTSAQIHVKMMKQFHDHVSAFVQSPATRLLSKDKYFRTCKFMNDSVTTVDEHDGMSLWRKFGDIKKYILNSLTPCYSKCLGKDGRIPSGKSKEEILVKTRELLFRNEQEAAKAKSKNPRGYTIKEFSPDWYPQEWEVFILYGAPSPACHKVFFIE